MVRKRTQRHLAKMTRVFCQCLEERRWKEAETSLKKIQLCKTDRGEEWMKGYINAFDGMLIALRKTHPRPKPLILTMNNASLFRLKELRKIFDEESQRRLNADFEHGFYGSWSKYVDFLLQKHSHNVDQ